MAAAAGAEGEDRRVEPVKPLEPVEPVETEQTRMEPPVGAESRPFWEATREGTLLVQWCTSCDRGIFYPRFFCPYCAAAGPDDSAAGQSGQSDGSTLEWRTASGRAIVHAATVEHNPAATGATFSHGEPYVVALVDLDEGVRMMTNIVGCAPEDVRPGMAVTVTWEPLSDGRQLPLFSPAATRA